MKAPQATDASAAQRLLPGVHLHTLDSATLRLYNQRSVAAVLGEQTSVFVKSYGLNAMATLNIRGASSAQSAVLWNGVPIANPALGLTDVSTLPLSLIDEVAVAYGGSSALWGSGAVGGAVLLQSRLERRAGADISAGISAGSFGQQSASVRMRFGHARWGVGIRAFGQRANNDFPFLPASGGPVRRLPSGALAGGGALVQSYLRIGSSHDLEASVWAQQYERHVPPALFEDRSRKVQEDAALRSVLRWRWARPGSAGEMQINTAYLRDGLHYADTASRQYSSSTVHTVFADPAWRHMLRGDWTLRISTPVQHAWMEQADFSARQTKLAAVAGILSSARRPLAGSVLLRAEAVGSWGVLLPSLSGLWRVSEKLTLRTVIQRSFRAPTLAELYTVPGGNATLRPERGWSGELGASTGQTRARTRWNIEATAYYRTVQDWILWYGGAVWTPHNIAVVRSRGVEGSADARWTAGKVGLHTRAAAGYTRATTAASRAPGDGSIGKQIPYTPRVTATASAGATRKALTLLYAQHYVGQRYPTSDESSPLAAYTTGSFTLLADATVRARRLQASAALHNVWNARYVVVAGRPMPGRYVLLTASATLLRTEKKD